jgi:hypothetical protein
VAVAALAKGKIFGCLVAELEAEKRRYRCEICVCWTSGSIIEVGRKGMESKSPHRGITMHQLPIGSNFPGLLFAVGSALIFLLAIPALWYVVAGAVAVGLVVAAVLQLTHDRPDESKKLTLKI